MTDLYRGIPTDTLTPSLLSAPGRDPGAAPWLDANPNTVKAFVSAMSKAVEYMRSNPQDARKLISRFTGAKPELV